VNENPYLAFAKAIDLFYVRPRKEAFIHPSAHVSDTARVGSGVFIGALSFIGDGAVIGDRVEIGPHCTVLENAVIGEDSVICPGAVIRERVTLGKRCIVQSNAVVGSDGFGFAKQSDGSWYKIYQAGSVVVGDDVELGACTAVDRASLGDTSIGKGTKLDNLVHVGHACAIGDNTLLCAQVGLAGSTRVGSNVVLAGQVGAAGHLTIGDGVIAIAQSGIPRSVEPGRVISGSPAYDHKQWLRSSAIMARLPELHRTVTDLDTRVSQLEKSLQVAPEQSQKSNKQ
jgi:UDP-3-O-[3-hydroxymyristoyl] glucosamine N-acyltransferase